MRSPHFFVLHFIISFKPPSKKNKRCFFAFKMRGCYRDGYMKSFLTLTAAFLLSISSLNAVVHIYSVDTSMGPTPIHTSSVSDVVKNTSIMTASHNKWIWNSVAQVQEVGSGGNSGESGFFSESIIYLILGCMLAVVIFLKKRAKAL